MINQYITFPINIYTLIMCQIYLKSFYWSYIFFHFYVLIQCLFNLNQRKNDFSNNDTNFFTINPLFIWLTSDAINNFVRQVATKVVEIGGGGVHLFQKRMISYNLCQRLLFYTMNYAYRYDSNEVHFSSFTYK